MTITADMDVAANGMDMSNMGEKFRWIREKMSGVGDTGETYVILMRFLELSRSFEHENRLYMETITELVESIAYQVISKRISLEEVNLLFASWESRIESLDNADFVGRDRADIEKSIIETIQSSADDHGASSILKDIDLSNCDIRNIEPEDVEKGLELFSRVVRQRALYAGSISDEANVSLFFHFSENPDIATLARIYAVLSSLLTAANLGSAYSTSVRIGSRWEEIQVRIKAFFSKEDTREIIKNICRETYDSLTNKSAKKSKEQAEGERIVTETKLAELEILLKEDTADVRRVREFAEAKIAVEKARQAELETALKRQDLIDRSTGELKDILADQQMFALCMNGDGQFSMVSGEGIVVWEEEGEIKHIRRIAGKHEEETSGDDSND